MKNYTILFLLILFACGSSAQSLDDALLQGAENNPTLKAAFARYRAALERVPQVGVLPDPTVSFGVFVLPVETRTGPQLGKISLSQKFPWFGTLEAQRSVSAKQAEEAYHQAVILRNEFQKEVKISWYQMIRINLISGLHMEQIKLLKSIEELALSRVKSGKGKLTDVLRVQMEIEMQETLHATMTDELRPRQSAFNHLLGNVSDQEMELPESLPLLMDYPNKTRLRDSLLANPIFQLLEARSATIAARQTLIGRMGNPSIGVGLDYAFVGQRADADVPHEGRDILMPMVSLSIPVFRKKYLAMEKEQSLLLESNAADRQGQIDRLTDELELSLHSWREASRNISLYGKLIQKAESIFDLLIRSYSNEGKDFEVLLEIQEEILAYKKETVLSRFAGHVAIANIEKLIAK